MNGAVDEITKDFLVVMASIIPIARVAELGASVLGGLILENQMKPEVREREQLILQNTIEETTTLFRAVDAAEANIIQQTGEFSLQEGGVEVKYFAQSLQDAQWYGDRIYPNGCSVIQATVNGPINQYWHPYVDIGAYIFPGSFLNNITPLIGK